MEIIFALIAIIVPMLFFTRITKPRSSSLGLTCFEFILLAFTLWISFWGGRRVILRADAIEVAWWLSSRMLSRAEIRGYRMGTLKGKASGSYYVIVPVDTGKRELKLPPYLYTDEYFLLWMKTIRKIER
jgi:hypothetical protein